MSSIGSRGVAINWRALIQKRYGIAKDDVERQVKKFQQSCDQCAMRGGTVP